MWFALALGSAFCTSLAAILAKLVSSDVNSNLATLIRTCVVLVVSCCTVFLSHAHTGISAIAPRSWFFLLSSSLATSAAWLLYFKALQLGDASKVDPTDKLCMVITIILACVILHEKLSIKSAVGAIFITAGILITVL